MATGEALSGLLVAQAARAGDPASMDLLREVGDWLGVGMAGLSAAFDNGLFVVGGGVSDAGELLLSPARDAFRRTLTGRGFRSEARIVRAHLGNEAGMVGAADLARSRTNRRSRSRSSLAPPGSRRRGRLDGVPALGPPQPDRPCPEPSQCCGPVAAIAPMARRAAQPWLRRPGPRPEPLTRTGAADRATGALTGRQRSTRVSSTV